ncbi:hypothetical protein [Deinococcus enclensis]|uniref:Transcription factor zinc-finger domain-containing protein n=1 Tax=Deinococcus enclensis TaxID=1049582 RepID=A0ABT9MFV6_9DEIO|nr:hypothetical protein [Deinococcus enclensis]MDP9765484.1 hypothetical protein [Deinococcus enclensis]
MRDVQLDQIQGVRSERCPHCQGQYLAVTEVDPAKNWGACVNTLCRGHDAETLNAAISVWWLFYPHPF